MVTQSEVTLKNQTVQVELDPEQVITTQTIIIESQAETKIVRIQAETSDKKGMIIMVVVLSLFTLVITAVCIRYALMKKT